MPGGNVSFGLAVEQELAVGTSLVQHIVEDSTSSFREFVGADETGLRRWCPRTSQLTTHTFSGGHIGVCVGSRAPLGMWRVAREWLTALQEDCA